MNLSYPTDRTFAEQNYALFRERRLDEHSPFEKVGTICYFGTREGAEMAAKHYNRYCHVTDKSDMRYALVER